MWIPLVYMFDFKCNLLLVGSLVFRQSFNLTIRQHNFSGNYQVDKGGCHEI